MADPPTIDAAMCERFVSAASRACPTPAAPPPTTPVTAASTAQPEWDALASSLAGIGLAVAWGGTVLAIVALIAGIAWAKLLRGVARSEAQAVAREEARKCAEERMKVWLAEVAPQIISKHMQNIQDASLGDDDDAKAADDMGKEA